MSSDAPPVPLSDAEVAEGLRALQARPTEVLYSIFYALFTGAYVWLAWIEWGGVLGWIWLSAASMLAMLPFVSKPIRVWRFARQSPSARRENYRKQLKQTLYWDSPPILWLAIGVVLGAMQLIVRAGPPPMAVILPTMCVMMAIRMQRSRLGAARHREHLARLEGAPPQGAPERATT